VVGGKFGRNKGVEVEVFSIFPESGWWGRIISCCQAPTE